MTCRSLVCFDFNDPADTPDNPVWMSGVKKLSIRHRQIDVRCELIYIYIFHTGHNAKIVIKKILHRRIN